MAAPSGPEFATALHVLAQNDILDALDAGAGSAVLRLYTESDSNIATMTLSNPAGSVDVNGQLTVTAAASATASAEGIITWGEFQDSDANFVCRAPVSVGASPVSGQIVLSDDEVFPGASVELISCTFG